MNSLVVFVLFLSASITAAKPSCAVDTKERTPCNAAKLSSTDGGTIFTADSCIASGCCWMKSLDIENANLDCYASKDDTQFGYDLVSFKQVENGFEGMLQLTSEGNDVYGADIQTLFLQILTPTESIVEVKISHATETRWEIPESVLPRPFPKAISSDAQQYRVQYSEKPFSLQIIRKSDEEIIYHLDSFLIFKDQYIEFNLLSNNTIRRTYGYGESARTSQALEVNRMYTLWAVDLPSLYLSENLYGSLPFGLQQISPTSQAKNVGASHGHVFLNSNGMDITMYEDRINFKVIGGIIDFFIFVGPTAKQVVQQSTEVIGKPAMIPYWTLGFHNCRYGYESIQQVEEVVQNYSKANLPLDTQWLDIDYMREYRDFTLNETAFPPTEVQSFVTQLHDNGQRLVPIIDPGIKMEVGYEAYDQGKARDLFIKDAWGNDYVGQVWPGVTTFPDFFHPEAQEYWTEQLTQFHELVDYDGLWIDMNEVSNFCNKDGTGQVCVNDHPETCQAMSSTCCLTCTTLDATNKYDYPPYHINSFYGRIGGKTVAMSSRLANNQYLYYNTHNLYGLTEQIATNRALQQITGKRPFLLTRSSFLSTGKYAAKWSGDNAATWYSLRSSIISMLDYNLFSIPFIGSDICGFLKDTTEELCARWVAVGAFYPFSRNHNDRHQSSQEFYLWESVTEAAQKAYSIRYQLLPYYYTLFYEAHTQGTPVMQSLWMNYPTDPEVVGIDQQFLIGSSILISPVLERGRRSVKAYFPKGMWYEYTSKRLFLSEADSGAWKHLISNLTDCQVHIRGGVILPLQQAALTTTAGRKTPFTLLVAFSADYRADGHLFWDDGEQVELSSYLSLQMHAAYDPTTAVGKMTTNPLVNTWNGASENIIDTVEILSPTMSYPKKFTVNQRLISREQWSYSPLTQIITIQHLQSSLSSSLEIMWE